ncbi:MAG: hypothetical protein OXE53_18170 [Deltaproteobacteria bacterium]|nr:hypothetical protein [Deltaproteobacteria bacterium]
MKRRLNVDKLRLGMAAELTADEARAMAIAEIEAAEAECRTGPLFRYFADEFMRRQGSRWKPATRINSQRETDPCPKTTTSDARPSHS